MIGKGKFFDLISRLADDVNNTEKGIKEVMDNFNSKEEKFGRAYHQQNSLER